MTTVIPALSMWQPWASLVCPPGPKYVETRSWAPHRDLLGQRIAFASTASIPKDAKDALRAGVPGAQELLDATRNAGFRIARDGRTLRHNLPLGRVLCTAIVAGGYPMVDAGDAVIPERCLLVGPSRLVIVRPEGDLDVSDQRPFGVFEAGRWAWLLEGRRAVVGTHRAVGRQGIWNWRPTGIWDVAAN